MAAKSKDRRQDRKNRPNEEATIGDAQQEIERRREETRRRKEDGTARHGRPPGVHGLEGDDEPHGQDPAGRDQREGVISRHTFRHVSKGEHHKPKWEEDG